MARPIPTHLNEKRGRRNEARRQQSTTRPPIWIPLFLALYPPRSKEWLCGQHQSVKCLSVWMPDMRTSLSESTTRTQSDTFTHASFTTFRFSFVMGKFANNPCPDAKRARQVKSPQTMTSHRTVARCRSTARQRVPRQAAQCEQLLYVARPTPAHLDEKARGPNQSAQTTKYDTAANVGSHCFLPQEAKSANVKHHSVKCLSGVFARYAHVALGIVHTHGTATRSRHASLLLRVIRCRLTRKKFANNASLDATESKTLQTTDFSSHCCSLLVHREAKSSTVGNTM